jgi:hypothetical protein
VRKEMIFKRTSPLLVVLTVLVLSGCSQTATDSPNGAPVSQDAVEEAYQAARLLLPNSVPAGFPDATVVVTRSTDAEPLAEWCATDSDTKTIEGAPDRSPVLSITAAIAPEGIEVEDDWQSYATSTLVVYPPKRAAGNIGHLVGDLRGDCPTALITADTGRRLDMVVQAKPEGPWRAVTMVQAPNSDIVLIVTAAGTDPASAQRSLAQAYQTHLLRFAKTPPGILDRLTRFAEAASVQGLPQSSPISPGEPPSAADDSQSASDGPGQKLDG